MLMKESSGTTKKPYSAPTLSRYGDLADLTKSASKNATMMDGGNNAIKSN